MRNNQLMSWLVGAGAVVLAVAGWVIPRRRKTPAQRMMNWSRGSMEWLGSMAVPASRMLMRRMKGMVR
ncbi:LPXTG cell wall anchor domain-containing protein [Ammoniphilus sp. CFH 90114]|uniref:LPXTG cell wall anchor domain-containing protein n=1 Tax=Ammoniphilus sp. CFH 90114 TaxID=2493665 RepID=UPI00100DA54E|nr:LPXTG cell wall anchor domain-containing protein [Ammoniphilus sp. CFH 90114]RXT14770.1 LPXTG cell wall anchor domain-containing protein [Ammoniphilus sp. CFH 90114]